MVTELREYESGAVRSKDADNVRYDLISPIALRRLAEVCHEGAVKYGSHNWERGMPVADLLNHAIRHLFLYLAGDRSEDHLGHALWGVAAGVHSEECWPELNAGTLRRPGCLPPLAEEGATPCESNSGGRTPPESGGPEGSTGGWGRIEARPFRCPECGSERVRIERVWVIHDSDESAELNTSGVEDCDGLRCHDFTNEESCGLEVGFRCVNDHEFLLYRSYDEPDGLVIRGRRD